MMNLKSLLTKLVNKLTNPFIYPRQYHTPAKGDAANDFLSIMGDMGKVTQDLSKVTKDEVRRHKKCD